MAKKTAGNVLFAERLRGLRKARGWTQQQIAEQLQIKRSTYAYYETRTSEPDMETLIRLATLLHTSIDYLIGNVADSEPRHYLYQTTVGTETALSEREETLLRMFRAVDTYKQERVLEQLNGMLRDTYAQFPDETDIHA